MSFVVILRRSQLYFPVVLKQRQEKINHIYNLFYESIFFFFTKYWILIASVMKSRLSLSLNRFVQTHPLTTAINIQMNSVLFVLKSTVYKVHSISTDFNRKFVSVFSEWNLKTCS